MDDLREDLRSQFERQQAGLGEIRGARETLVKRALARSDEPLSGRLQFAAGIAAILIAALVIATFAYVRGRGALHEGPPGPAASSSRLASPVALPSPLVLPSSKPPTIPPRTWILDMDLVDLSSGWVLFTNCVQPMTGACHYWVVATQNTGGTWSKPSQVGGGFDPGDGDAPRTVHFLNRSDGFVYGGSIAFVSHDGGRTWARLNFPAVFVTFITGRGSVAWAATYPCAKGQVCSYELRSSGDGGHSWSKPYEFPTGFSPDKAVPFAASGLLVSTSVDLVITLDAGATWRLIKSPCTSESLLWKQVATSDGRELWLLCSDFPAQSGAINKVLYISEDSGASWKQRATSQHGGHLSDQGQGADFVSLAAGTALYNAGSAGVMVSHDGGVTWTSASPNGLQVGEVRFCSATDGWAVDTQNYIWATTDGGNHWTQVTGIQIQSP